MKRIWIILLGVILAVLGLCFYPILTVQAVSRSSTGLSRTEQLLLGSTVQISLFPNDDEYHERGLGTVVTYKGERLLVTHNHWTSLKNLDRVDFLSAKGQLLMELNQQEFNRLILYSRPGTLILKAPAELKSYPVELGVVEIARVGDVVTVIYRKASNRNQLGLFQAKIRAIKSFERDTAYQLVASNGEKLLHGDSGGGIWLDGQYVGNMWAVENNTHCILFCWTSSQTEYAAEFPSGFFQLMEMSDSVIQSNQSVGKGKHGEEDVP